MLDDLAFKRGTRWVWDPGGTGRAVAGLTANPSRAAIDAASLALDVHEAISGFKDDLPAPVAASIGIVRGIASGTRDPEGHLIRYVLHEPTTFLSDVLGRATPEGRTWVAGGVYRLVRKDFLWGDVPSLEIDAAVATDVPSTMRLYALERRGRRAISSDVTARRRTCTRAFTKPSMDGVGRVSSRRERSSERWASARRRSCPRFSTKWLRRSGWCEPSALR
jgi:hypothetical protein